MQDTNNVKHLRVHFYVKELLIEFPIIKKAQ